MPEPLVTPNSEPSRMVQALIQVAQDVAEEVIRKAKATHTPVIVADETGCVVFVDPDKLAKDLNL